jgi:hypothetical protein
MINKRLAGPKGAAIWRGLNYMERLFKTLFYLALIIFCLLIIGVFLLIIKISLLFLAEINFFGIHFTLG